MTLIELKKGLIELLQTIFPDYNYYSMEVVEDYDRPCFFTQLKPTNTQAKNYNTKNNQMTFYIDYLQEQIDEVDMLETIDKLRNLFELSVRIKDRSIDVEGFDWDFVGTKRNILEVSIDLQWDEKIEHLDNSPLIESVEMHNEMEE